MPALELSVEQNVGSASINFHHQERGQTKNTKRSITKSVNSCSGNAVKRIMGLEWNISETKKGDDIMKKRQKSTPKLTVIFPDIHFAHGVNGQKPMDRHDPVALSVAFQILRDLRPDSFIQLGDLFHGSYLSHWNVAKDMMGRTVGNDGELLNMCLKDDHRLINLFWDKVQEAVGKNADVYGMEGNHEEILRNLRYMNKHNGLDKDQFYPEVMWRLKERGIKWIPYQRYENKPNWVEVGPYLKVLHGQYCSTNHLTKHFQHHLTNLIYGHVHNIEEKSFPSPSNHISVKSIGCLCTRTASYHRGRNNAWGQAICLVYTLPSGEFYDQVVRIINGKAVYAGKVYVGKPESWME